MSAMGIKYERGAIYLTLLLYPFENDVSSTFYNFNCLSWYSTSMMIPTWFLAVRNIFILIYRGFYASFKNIFVFICSN